MGRALFRVVYGMLLVAIFVAAGWVAFRRSIVGRSVTVPDLAGRSVPEATRAAQEAGLRLEEQTGRARHDDKIPRGRVLLQQPEGGTLAKPAQAIRVVLSLGPREIRVPELSGLPPRAAAVRLSDESLTLGGVSWFRDAAARTGIVAQDPEPDTVVARNVAVAVLTNRGQPETRFVMPDLIGQDADRMKARLETFGFRVGSARYESYEGIAPNTILKQFPPAGYPLSSGEVVSLTVSRPAEGSHGATR
ncbi:MAG TPA: PASTA domain-containing protein [Thermoanaerobaculia bacterium]